MARHNRGFSLVEVTMAIGIIGFAFTAIFGLLPIALNVARKATATTVSSQILERVISDTKQGSFGGLTSGTMSFDDQATLLSVSSAPTKIYDVQVLINSGSLPGAPAINSNLQRVQITIVSNPGNVANAFNGSLPATTYCAFIARSGT
jgi:uncharacterized protein (TIGR02598 family)